MQTDSKRPLAVVTGASSGIGLELARQFARNGYDLILTATSETGLAEAARKISAEGALVVDQIPSDLTVAENVDTLFARIQSHGRPVDAIALNAGIGISGEFAGTAGKVTSLETEMKLIQLNVVSTVHLAKHVIKTMVERGKGHVLFTASIAAITPAPYEAVYAASKAFVKTFAESLRGELQDKGVVVTALMPGPTETNFFHRANMDDTRIGSGTKDDPAEVAREGFEALMAGKDHIVAGSLKTKVQGALMENVLPQTVKAALHKKRAAPGSAK